MSITLYQIQELCLAYNLTAEFNGDWMALIVQPIVAGETLPDEVLQLPHCLFVPAYQFAFIPLH
jgi:hypothetical protein